MITAKLKFAGKYGWKVLFFAVLSPIEVGIGEQSGHNVGNMSQRAMRLPPNL